MSTAQADSDQLVNPNNNHSYQRFDTALTWDAAKSACETVGGHLATMTSQEENDWIVANDLLVPDNGVWFGASDAAQEGTWTWVTGEAWNYSNWYPGEPNDLYGEDALVQVQGSEGDWNDGQNVSEVPYLCEWEPDTNNRIVNPDNGHSYQRFDTALTWDAAKSACEELDAHLATVTSQEENDWISNNLLMVNLDPPNVWLGASDAEQEGTWKWITGETWNYSNWWPGEPNNAGGSPPQNYLQMYLNSEFKGYWDDFWGDLAYLCEWDTDGPAPTEYTLNVFKTGKGIITSTPAGIDCGATCEATFAKGKSVTLTATASDGYQFSGWTGACSGKAKCTVKMNEDISAVATFKAATYSLTISKVGTGTITSSPTGINCGSDCSENYNANTAITLTATAGDRFTFTGWSGDCTGTNKCSVNMTANKRATATFAAAKNADVIITNISITPTTPNARNVFAAVITIKNQGSAATDGGYLDVWLDQSREMSCGSDGNMWANIGTIAAGASKTLAVTLRAGSAGNKTLRVFADSWCEATESKEDNNQLTKAYTVK